MKEKDSEFYITPATVSSHYAVTAWLKTVCSVASPFSPSAMLALMESLFTDSTPEAIMKLAKACESAADAAHEAKWALLDKSGEVPERNRIRIEEDQGRMTWHSSVECGVCWWKEGEEIMWRVYIDGVHLQRKEKLEEEASKWPSNEELR